MSKSDPFAARRAVNVNPTQPNEPPSETFRQMIAGDVPNIPRSSGPFVPQPPPEPEAEAQVRRVLYLGCAPQRGSRTPSVWFDEWVAPLTAQAAESQSVPHYSCADYGQGKAALLALVTAKAQAGDIPQSLIVDRRLPAADACVEVLLPHYHVVIGKLG